ncbi:hypothetical protein C8D89_12167 [Actinomycetospora cinnamomea]|uniref:Probable membrane transporter protein n=2 Tax=Actinomycetospora cinnamomea TaxID=663609 RepID=A0A2U1EU61_9PSEU|nr:hypothetical protein C8D89_12167 [Actinomycetospora cinnamomea]
MYESITRAGDPHAHPFAPERHHVAGAELAAPAALRTPVDGHRAGLEDLPRGRAVLDEAGELEQLAETDRVVADLDVADGCALHLRECAGWCRGGGMAPMGGVLLVLAGVGAGLTGSMAGLASLFSYPALLATGLSPVVANQTNTIALAVSSVGSMLGSRPELRGQVTRVLRLLPLTILGGAVGALLVLLTPSDAFALIVPFLVAGASLVLLWRPRTDARPVSSRAGRALTVVGVVAVGVYSGYFGAAAGVVMMALLVRALADTLVRVNAVKNVLLGASNAVAAVGFAVVGEVSWSAALPLTAGLLVGNYCGPAIARRLPPTILRLGIAGAGLVLAAVLLHRAVTS